MDTGCVDDVTVFIHGWDKDSDDDAEQTAYGKIKHAGHGLYDDGYWGEVIGYTWDSEKGDGSDYGWNEAQEIAQRNGYKLAQFAVDSKYNCPDATLRFESHSPGAQVLLSCLRVLDDSSWWTDTGHQIESTHLLGAAQDNEAPTLEWPDTYYAIRDQTRASFNYYSEEDDILEWIYNTFEFDQALGETGAESGNTPAPTTPTTTRPARWATTTRRTSTTARTKSSTTCGTSTTTTDGPGARPVGPTGRSTDRTDAGPIARFEALKRPPSEPSVMKRLIVHGDPGIRKGAVINYDGKEQICYSISRQGEWHGPDRMQLWCVIGTAEEREDFEQRNYIPVHLDTDTVEADAVDVVQKKGDLPA